MQNSFGAFYFSEFKPHNTIPTQHTIATKIGIGSIFTPFSFVVLFSLWNLQNKGLVNIKGQYSRPRPESEGLWFVEYIYTGQVAFSGWALKHCGQQMQVNVVL